ncbi:hypothetical protein B0H19DRAFT_1105171 [Mycena capillaripes]|nr:hypothetical protein B0H19DRAFT_1105171 [Mycena capillaripes]
METRGIAPRVLEISSRKPFGQRRALEHEARPRGASLVSCRDNGIGWRKPMGLCACFVAPQGPRGWPTGGRPRSCGPLPREHPSFSFHGWVLMSVGRHCFASRLELPVNSPTSLVYFTHASQRYDMCRVVSCRGNGACACARGRTRKNVSEGGCSYATPSTGEGDPADSGRTLSAFTSNVGCGLRIRIQQPCTRPLHLHSNAILRTEPLIKAIRGAGTATESIQYSSKLSAFRSKFFELAPNLP